MLTVATALGGVIVSVLLFLLMRVQLRARSEAERIAETLRRSEGELQAASRAKDEFLATLSHELRTPMTAILGWSKMLAEELDPDTQKMATDAILKSSKSQAQLIDDLLDVSRITSGKMNIEPAALDLAPIVRAAVDAVSPAADAKGVTIGVTLPADVVQVGISSPTP
jgi:signal transduction histidine kinase